MRISTGLLAAAAMLLTEAAWAVPVPSLSGAYNLTSTTVCQASVVWGEKSVDVPPFKKVPTTTDVGTVTSTSTGNVKQLFITATFATGGVITASGTQWVGDLVFNGAQGPASGLQTQPISVSGTYSNTTTQLSVTIPGSSPKTYQVLYSNVVGGVAQRVDLADVDTSAGCVERGMAVHQ